MTVCYSRCVKCYSGIFWISIDVTRIVKAAHYAVTCAHPGEAVIVVTDVKACGVRYCRAESVWCAPHRWRKRGGVRYRCEAMWCALPMWRCGVRYQ
jgi:hypothetical protein